MCKKEKYEKHRDVLVFFFAFAMLVVLNSQKLSLRELSIVAAFFFIDIPRVLWYNHGKRYLVFVGGLMKQKKILSFGEILWDVYPDKAFLGGASLNFSAHLAKHGEEAYLLSAVGEDTWGVRAKELLTRCGVHTDYVPSLHTFQTGQSIVTLTEDGTPSYRFLEDPAYDHIPSQPIPDNFDVLYFGTLALQSENNRQTLSALLSTHRFSEFFVDINLRAPFYSAETVAFAVANATILKISQEELPTVASLLGLSPTLPYQDLARAMQERFTNLKCIIITLGADGAYAREAEKEYSCAAVPAKVASTVGAGDSFSAAFLHRYLRGDDIPSALAHATKVAAFVVSHSEAVPDYAPEAL